MLDVIATTHRTLDNDRFWQTANMEPLYNSAGHVCAWIKGDTIRDRDGTVVAFVRGEHIFTTRGRTIGRLHQGDIRDKRGNIVAWLNGATGGPSRPVRSVTPVKPIAGVTPVRPVEPVAPVWPVPSLGWSSQSWGAFIQS